MATLGIKKLLSKFIFEIDNDSTDEDLTCRICSNLLVDAYQTHCGCKYCRKCITTYLNEGKKHCSGDKDECKEEYLAMDVNVNKSSMLDKKILKVRVICPNQLCHFSSPLHGMKDHLGVCHHQSIECPYTKFGCMNEGGPRDTVETHLNRDILAHSELLIGVINNLRNEVEGVKENFQLEMVALREESILKERKILERIEEEKRLREAEREELLALIREQKREIIELTEANKHTEATNVLETRLWFDEFRKAIDTVTVGMNKPAIVGELSLTVNEFTDWVTIIESPHFYSHANGYKLRVQLQPLVFGSSPGRYLRVLLWICKGEYDDLLSWPCRLTVQVSFVDQDTLQAQVTRVFKCGYYDRGCFNRPIDDDKPSYSCIDIALAPLYDIFDLICEDSLLVHICCRPLSLMQLEVANESM